jgi:type II secretory pathway pseudopilin PulG
MIPPDCIASSPVRPRTTWSPLHGGFTQVEVVVSSLIVGVVLVGAMQVLGGATRTNRAAANRLEPPGLAHQLMGEILALPYEDPQQPGGPIGLETGESNTSRADFDDLDDYHLWNKSSPQYQDGTPVPNSSGWRRQVWVEHFDPATGTTGSTETGIKSVRIQVTSPGGTSTQIRALRSKWGALQQPPTIDSQVVTFLDAQLQIGGNSEPAFATIHLKNHASD